jgi:hypothetical protein
MHSIIRLDKAVHAEWMDGCMYLLHVKAQTTDGVAAAVAIRCSRICIHVRIMYECLLCQLVPCTQASAGGGIVHRPFPTFPQPVWSVSRVWQPLLVAAWYVSLALCASFCIIV